MKEELIKLLESCGYKKTRTLGRAQVYAKAVEGNLAYILEVILNVKPKLVFQVKNRLRTLEQKTKTVSYDEATEIINAFEVLSRV